MVKIPILVIALCLACCPCLGDNNSARRYVNFKWQDDLFLTFCLLDRKEVQHELKMTAEQLVKIKHIVTPKDTDMPGFTEFLASLKKQQSSSNPSNPGRGGQPGTTSDAIRNWINTYQRRELAAMLSAVQKQRLGELLIQMRGPISIVDDEAVSSKLQLSSEQRARMKESVEAYETPLTWLQKRYGRQQIAGLRNETLRDRENEIEALFVVIRALEKERDDTLLLGLTQAQNALWASFQGRPLRIDWSPTSAFDQPFSELHFLTFDYLTRPGF